MNLYEIDKAILELVDDETGEIADEEAFEQLQMEREQKIENVALWIKNLTAEAEACKKEKQNFGDRQSRCEKKVNSLKEWLKNALDCKKFFSVDGKVNVSFKKSKKVVISEGTELSAEYLRYKDPEPDKKALTEALKAGVLIDGVTLEDSMSVIIK